VETTSPDLRVTINCRLELPSRALSDSAGVYTDSQEGRFAGELPPTRETTTRALDVCGLLCRLTRHFVLPSSYHKKYALT
jgi:hypothetical protein